MGKYSCKVGPVVKGRSGRGKKQGRYLSISSIIEILDRNRGKLTSSEGESGRSRLDRTICIHIPCTNGIVIVQVQVISILCEKGIL
jgi:hypothetical protein